MKLNLVKSIISILISALIAWGLYELSNYESKRLILAITSGVALSIGLIISFAGTFENMRYGVSIRLMMGIYSIIALILNFVFAFYDFSATVYFISNGLLLLIVVLICYSIYRA